MVWTSTLAPRLRAAGWHLVVSAFVAALAAALVFGLWYPGPFKELAGGTGLFFLVISVDVVLGPLLTLVVFDRRKGWPHLRRDLFVIAVLQTAGLVYGLHTVYVVRPVASVFEVDRLRVVTADSVRTQELPAAPPEYQTLPLTGPWFLSARAPRTEDERKDALFTALEGFDTGQRPSFWQPYALAQNEAVAKSRPLQVLSQRYPEQATVIEAAAQRAGLSLAQARFLPVMARGDWVAVLDPSGNVVSYLPLDGFF